MLRPGCAGLVGPTLWLSLLALPDLTGAGGPDSPQAPAAGAVKPAVVAPDGTALSVQLSTGAAVLGPGDSRRILIEATGKALGDGSLSMHVSCANPAVSAKGEFEARPIRDGKPVHAKGTVRLLVQEGAELPDEGVVVQVRVRQEFLDANRPAIDSLATLTVLPPKKPDQPAVEVLRGGSSLTVTAGKSESLVLFVRALRALPEGHHLTLWIDTSDLPLSLNVTPQQPVQFPLTTTKQGSARFTVEAELDTEPASRVLRVDLERREPVEGGGDRVAERSTMTVPVTVRPPAENDYVLERVDRAKLTIDQGEALNVPIRVGNLVDGEDPLELRVDRVTHAKASAEETVRAALDVERIPGGGVGALRKSMRIEVGPAVVAGSYSAVIHAQRGRLKHSLTVPFRVEKRGPIFEIEVDVAKQGVTLAAGKGQQVLLRLKASKPGADPVTLVVDGPMRGELGYSWATKQVTLSDTQPVEVPLTLKAPEQAERGKHWVRVLARTPSGNSNQSAAFNLETLPPPKEAGN